MKFPIEDFFSKYDQIRSFLRISSRLLKKSIMVNFIFYAVPVTDHFTILAGLIFYSFPDELELCMYGCFVVEKLLSKFS